MCIPFCNSPSNKTDFILTNPNSLHYEERTFLFPTSLSVLVPCSTNIFLPVLIHTYLASHVIPVQVVEKQLNERYVLMNIFKAWNMKAFFWQSNYHYVSYNGQLTENNFQIHTDNIHIWVWRIMPLTQHSWCIYCKLGGHFL